MNPGHDEDSEDDISDDETLGSDIPEVTVETVEERTKNLRCRFGVCYNQECRSAIAQR